MDNTIGLTNIVYRITNWIMKFIVINVMWLVFNLPIAYIIVSVLSYGEIEMLGLLLLPLAILSPFLFFPATMAMFATVREWIIEEKDTGMLIKAFWGHYKTNYKQSMIAGLVFTLIWVIWIIDLYFFYSLHILFVYIFIFIGAILFVVTINFFSINVHYIGNIRTTLKNTLLISLTGPGLFIGLLMINGIILYISLYAFRFLIIFFSFSASAYLSFGAFYYFYIKQDIKRRE